METRTVFLFLLAIIPLCNTAVIPENAPVHIHIEGPSASADVDIPNSPDEVVRIKRSGPGSGSPDFFGYIKRGITGKISQFAQASAGASAHFSKGSSGGGGGGGGYYYPAPHDISYGTKSFDFWTLKKSILNTLLQAVKAINGGIIAVKGQLIKGGGAIISAKGKLISMKGEAIANVGRHIITSAKLSPSGGWSASKPEVVEYSAPSGHGGPGPTAIVHPSPSYGPPPAEYGAPSGPSASAPTAGFPDHPSSTYGAPTAPAYGPPIGPSGSAAPSQAYLPQKVTGSYDGAGAHAGIVILKKIPKDVEIPSAALASLPLQDERHKVVKPTVDVTKTPLFVPDPTPYKPQPPPPPKHEHKAHPFFESALKPIPPPKTVYGSPIDAPPSLSSGSGPSGSGPSGSGPSSPSGHGAPQSPVFPTPSTFHSVTSPPGSVDESLIHNHNSHGITQPHFDINKPLEHYSGLKPPPFPHVDIKGVQTIFKNNNNLYLSKIPAPFEINSFGGDYRLSNFGLGALDNVHSVHSALPAPVKTDFSGALDSYTPSFSNLGTDFSSHLQYKTGILEHKGAPHFDVVKSVEYELPIQKRHEKRTEKRH